MQRPDVRMFDYSRSHNDSIADSLRGVEQFLPGVNTSFEETLSRHGLQNDLTQSTQIQINEKRKLTKIRKRRLRTARLRFLFFVVCLIAMIAFLTFNFSSNQAVKPGSWLFTTLDAWISPLLIAYMVLTIYLDAKSQVSRVLFVHRDRLYSLCFTFSLLVGTFFLFVALPITKRYHSIHRGCTSKEENCVSLIGIIMISCSHTFPIFFCLAMGKIIDHQYSFRNKWLEIVASCIYLAMYIVWVVTSYSLCKQWPYYVYRDMPDKFHIALHLGSFIALGIMYVLAQVIHQRKLRKKYSFATSSQVYNERANAFNKSMLADIEKDLEYLPAAPEFTIQTH